MLYFLVGLVAGVLLRRSYTKIAIALSMLAVVWFILIAVGFVMMTALSGATVTITWPILTPTVVGFLFGSLVRGKKHISKVSLAIKQ